ncbi:Aldo/keto reductase [Calocera viscosa TUFC12733]|uniref:Aldo/keto reductase n=1 Tax=Calocera viscosa (strain TUFC12733) TaxID=1330018 RepID=A0A167HZ85_CALVF|nr:Aldo/keto reductase [Calocera viscosa TUFC12733]
MASSEPPKVTYHRLGNSGLRISNPVLGCMSFGSDEWAPWVINEDKALPLLKAAWDLGVTTWDTANIYSNGESERIIAKALKKYNIPRNRVLILTKCHFLVGSTPGMRTLFQPELQNERDFVNQSGLSRGAIFNQVEDSLARLDTDYIDLLQIHRCDMNAPFEETMSALNDLVRSGKVRYIGASSMWAWQFQMYNSVAEKNGWTKFISMQSQYSLLNREEEREVNAYCNFAGIGLIPWGPVAGGHLARPLGEESTRSAGTKGTPFELKHSAADKEIIKRVGELATKKRWSMAQVSLAWINSKVTAPIVGISSPARLVEAIIPDKTLTPEEIKYLEEPYAPKPVHQ